MRAHKHVRMLQLLDGLATPRLSEFPVAPILENPIVQPILVDRGKLVTEGPAAPITFSVDSDPV